MNHIRLAAFSTLLQKASFTVEHSEHTVKTHKTPMIRTLNVLALSCLLPVETRKTTVRWFEIW
jgi:hypothetical protein